MAGRVSRQAEASEVLLKFSYQITPEVEAPVIMHHRAVFAHEEGVRAGDGEVVGALDAVGAGDALHPIGAGDELDAVGAGDVEDEGPTIVAFLRLP